MERKQLETEKAAADARVEFERKGALLGVLHGLVNVSVEGNETQIQMAAMRHDVSETAQEVQAMASAVEEMRVAVQSIAQTSETASSDARELENSADQSKAKALEATSSMERMNNAVGMAKSEAVKLAEASIQIGTIVEQIEQIAQQTNLLALNATIEAARAGEAGKGFAVVASEVKTLANQTGTATDDIRHRIEAVQEQVNRITSAMNESASTAALGQETVTDLAESLDRIGRNVANMAIRMTEISGVLTEQSAASDEIARSATVVSEIAGKNSTSIDGVISVVDTLGTMLNEQVGTFAELGDSAVIEIAKNDHAMFKKTIVDTLVGHGNLKPDDLPDVHSCRLGKWYDGAAAELGHFEAYRKLAKPHAVIHEAGRKALAMHHDGRPEEALAAIQELAGASREVSALLDELSTLKRNAAAA